jgi:hypothetical protein
MATRGRAKAQLRHAGACSRKVRHEDERAARGAARLIADRQNEAVNVYRCACCKGWHVGRTPTWRRADSA